MINKNKAFSSFSVGDLAKAKEFYSGILGLDVKEQENMGLMADLGGTKLFIYPKENHEPATFTVLNFPVDDIDKAVDELKSKGVEFEQYDYEPIKTDEKGIARSAGAEGNPSMAWFKDPAGNILSLMQEK